MALRRGRSAPMRLTKKRFITIMTAVLLLAVLMLHTLAFPSLPPPRTASPAATPTPAEAIAKPSATSRVEARKASAMQSAATAVEVDEPEVHVVFSTDCSGYQHWQSIALWYSSRQAGHRGAVTRIASGCGDRDKERIDYEWREIDDSGLFRVHFAPKGELEGNYKYSNKPSGLFHWLRHASPRPFVNYELGVVALLDPDQMLLRPITTAMAYGLRPLPTDRKALYDASGRPRVLANGPHELEALPTHVVRGQPVAQKYGIGGAWANAGSPKARRAWRSFDRARVCGDGAPCTRTTAAEAEAHYSVGPPYLMHVTDADHIAQAWLQAMPHVHAQYPYLLAEMYAYALASANLSLPHAQLHNLMVSNVGAGGEGWDWIDHRGESVCAGSQLATPPADTRRRPADNEFTNREHPPGPTAPTVLHFCQSYQLGGHKFGKRSVPHDIFSCEQGLFHFEAEKIGAAVQLSSDKESVRNAYFLCNIFPRLNAALLAYKRTVCPKRGIRDWNEEATIGAPLGLRGSHHTPSD